MVKLSCCYAYDCGILDAYSGLWHDTSRDEAVLTTGYLPQYHKSRNTVSSVSFKSLTTSSFSFYRKVTSHLSYTTYRHRSLMEAIGFAASIATIVDIAKAVYTVVSDIRGAPESVQRDSVALSGLSVAIDHLKNDHTINQDQLNVLVNICYGEALKLKSILDDLDLQPSPHTHNRSRLRNTWNSIRAVAKHGKLQELQASLERSKTLLSLVVGIMTKQDVQDVRDSLQAIEIQQSDILQNQLSAKEVNARILSQTDRMCSSVPDIWSRTAFQKLEHGISTSLFPQIPTMVQQEMAKVFPDIFREHVDCVMEKSSVTMMLGMKDGIDTIIREKMNEMSKVLIKDIPKENNSVTSQVSAANQVSKNRKYNLDSQGLDINGNSDTIDVGAMGLRNSLLVIGKESGDEAILFSSQVHERQGTWNNGTELLKHRRNTPHASKRKVWRHLQTLRRSFNLGIANIEIKVSLYELRQSGTSSTSEREFRSSMKFMPSMRLLGLLSQGTHISWSFQHENGWQRSLRVFPVVSRDAEIFEAIEYGQVDRVLELLRSNQATVFDTDPEGITPLHTAANFMQKGICKILLDFGALPNATMIDQGYPLLDAISSAEGTYVDKLEITNMLLDRGADPTMLANLGSINSMDCFVVNNNNNLYFPKLESVYVKLARHENVYFDPDEYRYGGMTALMFSCRFSGDLQELEYNIKNSHNPRLTVQYLGKYSEKYHEKYCGFTALHLFLRSSWSRLQDTDIYKVLQLFLNSSYDVQVASTPRPESEYFPVTPTYVALMGKRPSMFFIWCEVLRTKPENTNLSVADFARREYSRCIQYAQDGWSLKAVIYLLETDFSAEVRNGCQDCKYYSYQEVRDKLKERCMLQVFEKVNDALDIEDNYFLLRIGEPYERPEHRKSRFSRDIQSTLPQFGAVPFPHRAFSFINQDQLQRALRPETWNSSLSENTSDSDSTVSSSSSHYTDYSDLSFSWDGIQFSQKSSHFPDYFEWSKREYFVFNYDCCFDFKRHALFELWNGCACSQGPCFSGERECGYNVHYRWGHLAFMLRNECFGWASSNSATYIGLDLHFRVRDSTEHTYPLLECIKDVELCRMCRYWGYGIQLAQDRLRVD